MTTPPPKPPVTRIDLEAIGDGVTRVYYWREGWREGDRHESEDLKGESIYRLLPEYEKQGFTCEMCDSKHGRALRGKIVRVDFLKQADGWHLRKYPYGWTAKTRPLTDEIKTEKQINAAVKWCEEQGWQFRRPYPETIRAFKGEPRPVNDAATILLLRRYAQRDHRDSSVDLAYA